jgi:hypothetical protein
MFGCNHQCLWKYALFESEKDKAPHTMGLMMSMFDDVCSCFADQCSKPKLSRSFAQEDKSACENIPYRLWTLGKISILSV